MKRNWNRLNHYLNLNRSIVYPVMCLLWITTIFDSIFLTILLAVFTYLYYRKLFVLCLLLPLLHFSSYSENIKIIDVKSNYAIAQYRNEKYYLANHQHSLSFNDEINADVIEKYLSDTDFNQYLKHKKISKQLIITKVHQHTKSMHLKSLLHRYIIQNFTNEQQTFLLSVYFNYHYPIFIFYSLHYHFAIFLTLLNKKNRQLSWLSGLLILLFDFKVIVLMNLIRLLLLELEMDSKGKIALNIIFSIILFPNIVYDFSFYFYVIFQIVQLFYKERRQAILSFISVVCFHQIPILNLLCRKSIRKILLGNMIICSLLLVFPNILQLYVNSILLLLEKLPLISFNHHITIIEILLCGCCLIFYQKKYCKFLFYFILFLPTTFRPYQELIIIPNYNAPIYIYKPNFLNPVQIYSQKPLSQYYKNKYGIHYYTHLNEPLLTFNGLTYIAIKPIDNYKNLPIDMYISDTLNQTVIEQQNVKFVILVDSKKGNVDDELVLQQYRIPYIYTKKTLHYILVLNWRILI